MWRRWQRRNARRGFSIVEVVIAMTVIAVVSFAGISVMGSATAHINKTRLQTLAINDVANLWECFEAVDNQEDFDDAIAFAGLTVESKDGGLYVIKNARYIYRVNLSVTFGENKNFFATVINVESQKVIYTFGS